LRAEAASLRWVLIEDVLSHFIALRRPPPVPFGVAPPAIAGLGPRLSVGRTGLKSAPAAALAAPRADSHSATAWSGLDSLSALHAGVKASPGFVFAALDGLLFPGGGETRSSRRATWPATSARLPQGLWALKERPRSPPRLCPHVWVEGLSIHRRRCLIRFATWSPPLGCGENYML